MAIDKKQFNDNLKNVIDWTRKLSRNFDYKDGFYGTVFRQTNPIISNQPLYDIDGDYAVWDLDDLDLANYEEALKQALAVRPISQELYGDDLSALGRILCFSIGLTTHDKGMISESQCFFDESDVPPIDTWFYLDKTRSVNVIGTLYCWIPSPFVPVVREGMHYDLIECCEWLER